MKGKAGFIVPIVSFLFGVYVLLITLTSGGEQVVLLGLEISRGLAMMCGLIPLGGGVIIFLTLVSDRKRLAGQA